MGMTPREETKSLRTAYMDENGSEVFTCNATYSSRGIFTSFEMFNQSYCAEHKADVQDAISSFLYHLNTLLVESNLPIIQAENVDPE